MTYVQRPKAFLFDMDGLLLDTERMFLDAFLEITAEIGIPEPSAKSFFLDLVGTSSNVTTARLDAFLPTDIDRDAFDHEWRNRHAKNVENGIPVKPYAVQLLTAIQAKGVPIAVVTSTNAAPAHHHLDHAGLLSFFETICAGDEVPANKPDPAPYLIAAKRLGVEATSCIAFEDSDLGTTAAVRAGCKTFQIPDLRPVDRSLPDLGQVVVQNLGQAGVKLGLFDPALTSSEQL